MFSKKLYHNTDNSMKTLYKDYLNYTHNTLLDLHFVFKPSKLAALLHVMKVALILNGYGVRILSKNHKGFSVCMMGYVNGNHAFVTVRKSGIYYILIDELI